MTLNITNDFLSFWTNSINASFPYFLIYSSGSISDGNCTTNTFNPCSNNAWPVFKVASLPAKSPSNINVILEVNFFIKVTCSFESWVPILATTVFKPAWSDFITSIKPSSNMISSFFLMLLRALSRLYNNFLFWNIGVSGLFKYLSSWLVYVLAEYPTIRPWAFFNGNIILSLKRS